MSNGYTGKVLEVNLSDGTIKTVPTDMEIAKKYLGGKGYATYLLYKILKEYEKKGIAPKDINPLGEENVLIFATGPATGVVRFPTPGRYHVMALRSPLTGSVASANSGGKWGPYLKFAGFDAIIIKGKAEEPVYLEVVDGTAELKCAADLWGRTTFDTTKILSGRVGKRCSVACIGPAGENQVLFASIMNDDHRAAGRTGVGAIMGSKNLKAIVVAGDQKVEVAKPDEFKELAKTALEKMRKNPVTGEGLPTYGTAVLVNVINNAGIFPTKNWQTGVNEKADDISGETLAKEYLIRNGACWGCQIGCARITKVETGPFQILYSEGPEYESIWSLGGSTNVTDLAAIIKANHLCDELGMDTISMGSTIAAAMELREKGYIPDEDLEGVDLRFGNAAAMVEMVWRTAYKSGFGKYLALGSKRLAEIYGNPELSMSVKGLELPAYDPRGAKGIGLNYATANRGGCHVTGYTISPEILGLPEKIDPLTTEGKAQWVKAFQDFTCVVNSAVNCLFATFALGAEDYATLLSAVTGWDMSSEDIMKIGERIYNLERVIINKYGFDGKDDTLPKRLLAEPMPEGAAQGQVVDLEKMKEEYYKLRGWVNGVPTEEKLKELEIEL
ncbi:aldehyde ferredoxin oxidoreductase family protein [Archaeoglobus veneficus]|uniref:Aldehyde ferredoxin oxidoreductase n=1 Tax=Archaeoglobus veneficus (strain DSM 11195 / SNP6) TaxID=693661 RepID=F2KRP5_ARCVS|nr:aldehyde ferredoxin oxidoreductase family protein [Archaeoglobus veneficus]AEA47909.1 Aldehyde ferredoxin oxidoreductase [Archaeoglobus veneficus SNP6]